MKRGERSHQMGSVPCFGAFFVVLVSNFPPIVGEGVCVFIDADASGFGPRIVPYFLSRFYEVEYPKEELFVYFSVPEHAGDSPEVMRLWDKWRGVVEEEYGSLESVQGSVVGAANCEWNWTLPLKFLVANVAGLSAAMENYPSLPAKDGSYSGCSLSRGNDVPRACSEFIVPSAKMCTNFGILSTEGELNHDLVSLLDCMDDDSLYNKLIFSRSDVTEESLFKIGPDFKSYVINLERRPKRRRKVSKALLLLGLPHEIVDAVDGNSVPADELMKGMKVMEHYACPATGRNYLKKGEIGCFLSHRNVWKKIASSDAKFGIVFEDDVRLSTVRKLDDVLKEIFEEADRNLRDGWDLIYLGRKYMKGTPDPEPAFAGAKYIHTVPYSHWAVGYALTPAGARKLLRPEVLWNLIPVDEYIPVMYDGNPNEGWKARFPVRDLLAYCVEPAVVEPSYYPGDEHYLSDTEESPALGEGGSEDEEVDYSGSSAPIKIAGAGSENLWDRLSSFRQDYLRSSYAARESSGQQPKRKNCTKILSKCSQNAEFSAAAKPSVTTSHRIPDEL